MWPSDHNEVSVWQTGVFQPRITWNPLQMRGVSPVQLTLHGALHGLGVSLGRVSKRAMLGWAGLLSLPSGSIGR